MSDEKVEPVEDIGVGIRVGVHREKRTVIIDFAFPVKWIGLDPVDAVALANIILDKVGIIIGENEHERICGGETGEP